MTLADMNNTLYPKSLYDYYKKTIGEYNTSASSLMSIGDTRCRKS